MNPWFRKLLGAAMGLSLAAAAWATTVIPPSFDQLVNESDFVVRAVVKTVTSEVRVSSTGSRKIYSKVELDVKEVVAGTPPATVVLELLGGTVGSEAMWIEGAPRFNAGDEDILFVKGNGHTIYPLFAIMHGRYPILHESGTGRAYVARSDRSPLRAVSDVALPLAEGAAAAPVANAAASALSPEEFTRQIKAAINPHYVAKALN